MCVCVSSVCCGFDIFVKNKLLTRMRETVCINICGPCKTNGHRPQPHTSRFSLFMLSNDRCDIFFVVVVLFSVTILLFFAVVRVQQLSCYVRYLIVSLFVV